MGYISTCELCLLTLFFSMAMRTIVAILSAASVASSVELTKATWASAISGKTVFVKFLAPW